MRDVTEMVKIWVVYTDSVVKVICDENTTNGISCELKRKLELSVDFAYKTNTRLSRWMLLCLVASNMINVIKSSLNLLEQQI